MQLRRLYFSILFFSMAMLVTVAAAATDPKVKPAEKKDTTAGKGLEEKGFRNLFVNTPGTNGVAVAPQLNPQVQPFVEDYLKKHEKHLQSMKGWAGPYFSMMDAILQSYGLPKELKYLAVIESNLQSYAQSWAGAVGPWQFMPETGRRMGLRITYRYDERTDYYKSTHAAAKYLRELHDQLGDWLLVIAAYNGGPGNVQSAIRKSGSRDFWKLQFYLPQESRNHVKKFISTHYIMEGVAGQTTSTKEEWANHQTKMVDQIAQMQTQLDPAVLNNTATTEVQGRYNSVVVANALAMDINTFNALNPGFDAIVNTEKGYTLRIPTDKMEFFKTNRFNILYQSVVATMQQATNRSTQYPATEAKPAAKKSLN